MSKLEIDVSDESIDKLVVASLVEAKRCVFKYGEEEEYYCSLLEAFDMVLDHYGYDE